MRKALPSNGWLDVRLYLLLLIFSMSATSALFAQLSTSKLFSNGAVLQRNTPIPVWGWGNSGDTLNVTLSGVGNQVIVNEDGSWYTELPAFGPGGPHSLVINGPDQTITYTDILIGDVYLISGQSNMEWSLRNSDGGLAESQQANYPDIREYRIVKATEATKSFRLKSGSSWAKAVGTNSGNFSGVGYFFAKYLHAEIDVPIGLVNNSYGGARIEAFMSDEMLGYDENDVTLGNGETERQPTLIYNKMVHPILPYAYKGMVWYQAESNGDAMEDAVAYGDIFVNMITSYRESLGDSLPFLYVQLPNFGNPVGDTPSTWDVWPRLREQQDKALSLPNTAGVVTIDVGGTDIHPTNKEAVGRRLALAARKMIYGEDIVANSPRYLKNVLTDTGTVVIDFDPVGSGLELKNTEDDSVYAFALAGENGVFHWANAKLVGNQVVVWHPDIEEPYTVRYAWEYNPGPVNLYNVEGLPVSPFQTAVNAGFKIARFRAARSAIEEGQSTSLSWQVFNASSVTLDGTPIDSTGSKNISPASTTTYTLIAVNKDDATDIDTATVTVQVLDPENINRTYGKTTYASSYEDLASDSPKLPIYAVDEDSTTRWSSSWSDGQGTNPVDPNYDGTPDDEWITVDLGTFVDLNSVILEWEGAYGIQYDIESSLDGYYWSTAYEERASDGGQDVMNFESPIAARYVRMHGIQRATQYGYSLYEFAAFGPLSTIKPPTVNVYSTVGNMANASAESVTLYANTADEDGTVESVKFYVDNELVSTDTEAPFSFELTLTDATRYDVTAEATDNDDISIMSQTFTFFKDEGNFTRFEAENSILKGVYHEISNPAASARKYMDMQDGWSLTFDNIDFEEAGEHLINIRYLMNYGSPKYQYIVINDDTVATAEFTGESTSQWYNYAFTHNFDNKEGNTIAIKGFWNWMSFDYLDVAGIAVDTDVDEEAQLPKEVNLNQNYPNPFNPVTQISFDIPQTSELQLNIYDSAGRLINTLANGHYPAGHHSLSFDATKLSSGVYFYQLKGDFGILTRKMTLLK